VSLLFDTNILLHLARSGKAAEIVNPGHEQAATSVVVYAEAYSIAYQNGWGPRKVAELDAIFDSIGYFDINERTLIERYIEIDAYSQGRNPKIVSSFTPRNTGKNGLWIAATAAFLDLTLVTTDRDFDHLHGIFLSVRRIDPSRFRRP
jgi:tRNA(fMet)-specific endonuclease VapC